jgi:hypothetical protein
MSRATQEERLLELLQDGRLHSSLEIRNKLYIMSSAAVIFKLKKSGYHIITETKPCTSNPDSACIAWYRLIPKPSEQARLF